CPAGRGRLGERHRPGASAPLDEQLPVYRRNRASARGTLGCNRREATSRRSRPSRSRIWLAGGSSTSWSTPRCRFFTDASNSVHWGCAGRVRPCHPPEGSPPTAFDALLHRALANSAEAATRARRSLRTVGGLVQLEGLAAAEFLPAPTADQQTKRPVLAADADRDEVLDGLDYDEEISLGTWDNGKGVAAPTHVPDGRVQPPHAASNRPRELHRDRQRGKDAELIVFRSIRSRLHHDWQARGTAEPPEPDVPCCEVRRPSAW